MGNCSRHVGLTSHSSQLSLPHLARWEISMGLLVNKLWQCSLAGNVDLASHQPCVTDWAVYSPELKKTKGAVLRLEQAG